MRNAKNMLDSGRRDKTEIIAAIAAMTQKPARITHIMDQVNLSYPSLKKYIKLMLKLHLLETRAEAKSDEGGQVFQATVKGFTFLKAYCELLRIIYGEDFLQKANNLAVACLQYCKEPEYNPIL
jgi:predicted transcriptional regulator